MGKFINLTGRDFSHWKVIGPHTRVPKQSGKGQTTLWLCQCRCGTKREVRAGDFGNGKSRNCGCVRRKSVAARNWKHGFTHTREYVVWFGMKARCLNKKNSRYKRYGGRGITICKRWKTSFTAFIADMGWAPSTKHQLDRIDNDGDYTPGNVRWVLNTDNARNKPSAHKITFRGKTLPLNEWAERVGLKPKTVYTRIFKLGWDTIDALTKPALVKTRAHTKCR